MATPESADVNGTPARNILAALGTGLFTNAPKGTARDLYTRRGFGDVAVEIEFLIPQKSNSGVKMMGLYEIQITDSFGKTKLTGAAKVKGDPWKEAEQFARLQEALKAQTAKLAAATGSVESLRAQVGATSQACRDCHEKYRQVR